MSFLRKKRGKIKIIRDIAPDEIFLDSKNLPGFDMDQFEGRIEKPISKTTIIILTLLIILTSLSFLFKIVNLQIVNGKDYREQSERNSLRQSIVFADRGIIYDVHNTPLAWNLVKEEGEDFSRRQYIDSPGFSNLIGYISYPKTDSAGFYFEEYITGVEGIENIYDDFLKGENGSKIIETNALSDVVSQSITKQPDHGKDLHLTIDAEIQKELRNSLANIITQSGFKGGGGVIMDIFTGEILALVSFPEYDSNILSEGVDEKAINSFIFNEQNPFLNRIIDGLYTPGSIVKPFMSLAVLEENIIDPKKEIISTGTMVVPNPYNPDNPSYFNDWKAHGAVDLRRAIAVSSNIYFYQVGGGFEEQEGLGIERINKYMRMFGFGESIKTKEFNTPAGTIPNPEWKKKIFDDIWRIGDTYFTSIGQYGFQVTPLQIVSGVAMIANEGTLVEPHLISDSSLSTKIKRQIDISPDKFKIVKEGMRDSVLLGTARGLNYPDFEIAGKTGTAELGVSKDLVNAWVTGFFPYNNPRFAFTIILEKGSRHQMIGSVAVAREFFDWLKREKPEYIK